MSETPDMSNSRYQGEPVETCKRGNRGMTRLSADPIRYWRNVLKAKVRSRMNNGITQPSEDEKYLRYIIKGCE